MRITIPKPCHENWDAMQPEEGGRHCAACAFKVQDLSSASDAELIERIAEGQMPKCARFRTSQLNRLLVATAAVGLTESAAASKTHPNTSLVNPPDFLAVSIEDWTFITGDVAIPERTLLGFTTLRETPCDIPLHPTQLEPKEPTDSISEATPAAPNAPPSEPNPIPAIGPAALRLRREEE